MSQQFFDKKLHDFALYSNKILRKTQKNTKEVNSLDAEYHQFNFLQLAAYFGYYEVVQEILTTKDSDRLQRLNNANKGGSLSHPPQTPLVASLRSPSLGFFTHPVPQKAEEEEQQKEG